ncbi:HAD family hydrolase [Paenarthrobacter sp. DKR-5]|uniref:HAD family hydrolase n=1 Tax=Paenarthrobacter sp. DKR-5 TaxID=2835535 RepID=UPI001BDCE97A|nr:HAD family hydrolase [Paenarthrobacter sp. DKR-5]MBT1001782.1 HAD family hydrolase [Paenarthrobacter sp. DKR-5]
MHSNRQPSSAPGPVSLQAVLWDMDGTLVDTEPYWIESEYDLVERHGGSWSEGQARQLVGQSLVYSAGLLQDAGVRLERRQIIDELIGQVISKVRRYIPWRPGARELLHGLYEAEVPCALVTMSEGPLAAEIVSRLPHPYFRLHVTGDMVANGKPHPEPYLLALERLGETVEGITAAGCVALEDSLPGATSAQAAGLTTVGIPHIIALPEDAGRVHWDTLSGRTVADLRNLLAAGDRSAFSSAGTRAGDWAE